jgi:heat shock protein HtpX
MEDARELAVHKEKERLIPLFEEVYQKAKEQTPNISKNINLYIVDEISVNAFAIGGNTIVATRGLIETMNDDEIKGILAHEVAHIAHNDSRVQILITFGSTIYLWGFFIARWIIRRVELGTAKETPFASAIIGIIRFIVDLGINLVTLIATLLLMADSRQKEYRADQYAAQIGYGYELKQALYTLYDMQISDKRSLIQRYKASHPRIAYRIGKLEELEEIYGAE